MHSEGSENKSKQNKNEHAYPHQGHGTVPGKRVQIPVEYAHGRNTVKQN